MNSIKQSIWFLLTHSKIFLGILAIFAVFAMFININGHLSLIEASSLNLQLFIFLGVYLGGSLAKLKRNYLWNNNKKYKNSILHAYFIIILLVCVCIAPFLWTFVKISPLIIAMPFCISIFASHLVLGKNLLLKVLIPAIPIFIFQITKLGFGLNTALLLILIVTVVLVILMYKNIFYHYSDQKTTGKQGHANSMAFMTTGLNHKNLSKLNGFIGVILSKWIMHGRRNLDWTILMPHSRLLLITLFYVLFYLFFISIADDKIEKLIGIFSLLLLPNLLLGLVMESSNLLKQTKFFAHVFTGDKHKQLKNKILMSMDKNMLINALVFVGLIMLIINILAINISINVLILSLFVIIAVSLAIYPILMCMSWMNISLSLLVILIVYGTLLYQVISWIYKNPQLATTFPYVAGFVLACLVLRAVTQFLLWQRPMESLLSQK